MYREMVEAAKAAGQIYDETGDSECQPVLDRIGEREWTGSCADWRLLERTADEMDDHHATGATPQ